MHSVDNDNVLCARTAAMHLVENRFRKIPLFLLVKRVAVADDRVAGYNMAMEQHGLTPMIKRTAFGIEAASEAAEKASFWKRSPRCVAGYGMTIWRLAHFVQRISGLYLCTGRPWYGEF
ncbi:MAG: hypothetical protein R2688_01560 [Fimbriimonadaceae bacterium]